jgi:hypothetical protein
VLLRPGRPAGFGLPEALLAAAVVASALLAAGRLVPTAAERIVSGGRITRGGALAQALVEMIRGEALFDDVLAYDGLDTGRPETFPAACLPGGGPGCINPREERGEGRLDRWRRAVKDLPGGRAAVAVSSATAGAGQPRLATVTVTISWDDRLATGRARIATAIAERL